ncbi:MAG: DEAD/DEAH box helicase, partial [Clostridia bacterium]
MDLFHNYSEFFESVTGNEPFPYQRELGEASTWPKVLRVPTGAGKTLAVLCAWLWKRRFNPDPASKRNTPRRLVYCLPMRVLVEQVRDTVIEILKEAAHYEDAGEGIPIGVHVLMGGEPKVEWDLFPEEDAILIGTQDMLLSRALNRGYALSRYRWPIPYGLLNNDCLWIMDEVQLMGAGLGTSVQLDAFRRRWGTFGGSSTLWMSATLNPRWLHTADHQVPGAEDVIELGEQDFNSSYLSRIMRARSAGARLECMCS